MVTEIIFGKAIIFAVLFIWVFLSSLGFPGALTWLIYAGASAGSDLELFFMILTAAAAAIIGDFTAYEIANKFSGKVYPKIVKFRFFSSREGKARALFRKSEFLFIFLTRFALLSLCTVVSYISGLERFDKRKFMTAVVAGEVLYASIYPILGFMFKQSWEQLAITVNYVVWAAVLVTLVFIAVKFVYTKNKQRLEKKKKLGF